MFDGLLWDNFEYLMLWTNIFSGYEWPQLGASELLTAQIMQVIHILPFILCNYCQHYHYHYHLFWFASMYVVRQCVSGNVFVHERGRLRESEWEGGDRVDTKVELLALPLKCMSCASRACNSRLCNLTVWWGFVALSLALSPFLSLSLSLFVCIGPILARTCMVSRSGRNTNKWWFAWAPARSQRLSLWDLFILRRYVSLVPWIWLSRLISRSVLAHMVRLCWHV